MIKWIFGNILIFVIFFLILSAAADLYYYNRVIEKHAYPVGQICYSDFKVFWLAAYNLQHHVLKVLDRSKGYPVFRPFWFLNRAGRHSVRTLSRPGAEYPVYNKSESFYHFRYSPFIAYLMIPLGSITPANALLIWSSILNMTFLVTLFILIKQARADFGLSDKQTILSLWLIFIISLRFYLMNIALGQTDIFIVFLFTLFLAAYIKGRFVICGILLGLVLQLKPLFLPILIYFFFTGRGKIAFSASASFAVFMLIPSHILGITKTVSLAKDWIEILFISVPSQIQNVKNQSLTFLIGGLLFKHYENKDMLGLFYFLSILLTSSICLLLFLARKRIYERDKTGFAYLEISVLIIVSILFSPLAWEAYFISLAIPFAAVLGFMKNSADRRFIYAALFLFFILSCVVGTDLTKFIFDINDSRFANIAIGTLPLALALVYSYKQRL